MAGLWGVRLVAIQRSLLIEAPAAYTASFWSDFEQFPKFMENLASVDISGPGQMFWRRTTEHPARDVEVHLIEHVDGRVLRWRYSHGPERSVAVTFAPLAGEATWLTFTLDYEPHLSDGNDDEVAAVARRVDRELRSARDIVEDRFLESRLAATRPRR